MICGGVSLNRAVRLVRDGAVKKRAQFLHFALLAMRLELVAPEREDAGA